MIRRPPRSTPLYSSAASDVYKRQLLRQGVPSNRMRIVRRVHLRYDGTDSALIVDFGSIADMVKQFESAYRKRYSFLMPKRALLAEAVSVEAIGASDAPTEVAPAARARSGPAQAADTAPQAADIV